jgi:glycosyltransferase involved in cell wall biosynthesis
MPDSNKYSVQYLDGLKIVRLRTFQRRLPALPMPYLFYFQGLRAAIFKEKSDIYHINNRYQYFSDTVSAVRSMDKKIALTIHNALPRDIDFTTDNLGRFYDWWWGKRLMREADVITAVSGNTARTTVPSDCLKKTHVVFNGVDSSNFRKIEKNDPKVKRIIDELGFEGASIITNGRLVPQKGQIYLIRAVAELQRKGRELNLLVVGKGPLRGKLVKSAKRLGISNRFRIVWGLGDESLPYYYNACDIFAFPSLYEPAGLAVCEAMSCELPAVVSKIGGIPEIAGEYGYYVKPKDERSIVQRLEYVLDNKRLAERRAGIGRKRMIKYFNWDKIAKEYENIFLETIRN